MAGRWEDSERGVVRKLGERGWPAAEIARHLGLDVEHVRRLLRCERRDYREEGRRRRAKWSLDETGPVGRCPRCGAKVYLPCRACKLRARMERAG